MIFIPILLGLVSRIAGSQYKYIGIAAYATIYGLLGANLFQNFIIALWVSVWKITGHADGFRGYERDNFLSKFVLIIARRLGIFRSSILYDVLFWFVKGSLIALLPAVLTGNVWLFIASAIGYPLAYHLGFSYLGMRKLKSAPYNIENFDIPPKLTFLAKYKIMPMTYGEFLAGFFSGLGFLL